jgi:hypothetical protein
MKTENAPRFWCRNTGRAGLGVIGLSGLCVQDAAQGAPCSFAWREPVSGSFADPSRWYPGPPPPAGLAECQGIAPRLGDPVYLRQGTYTVAVLGVQSSIFAEFAPPATPPFVPFDVTFDMVNAWTIGQFFPIGTVRIIGDDTLGVGECFGAANFILDGGRASFSKLAAGPFLVRGEKARLTTSERFGVNNIEVDGGQWTHTGVAGTSAPGLALLKNGAVFTAAVLQLSRAHDVLAGESGSLFSIGDLKGGTVRLSGGARMNNTDVTDVFSSAGFASSLVSGPITERSRPAAARGRWSSRDHLPRDRPGPSSSRSPAPLPACCTMS